MTCAKCGYSPPRGRPKKLDDAEVRKLHAKGLSLGAIADKLGVTRSAVQASLRRQT